MQYYAKVKKSEGVFLVSLPLVRFCSADGKTGEVFYLHLFLDSWKYFRMYALHLKTNSKITIWF